MTIVPTNIGLFSGVAVVVVLGAGLTLVHRPAAAVPAHHTDTSTSTDITPTLTSLGTPQIRVNGVDIPVTKGTKTVQMPNGDATVTVSGDSAAVSTSDGNVNQIFSTPSGNLNVSIHTSSSGSHDASSTSFQQMSSHSSVNASSSSNTSVSASGTSHIDIQTH